MGTVYRASGYSPGNIYLVRNPGESGLLEDNEYLVLDTPLTQPLLGVYMLQPLGIKAIEQGIIKVPGKQVPAGKFETGEYDLVGRINLVWDYYRDNGRTLAELVIRNKELIPHFGFSYSP